MADQPASRLRRQRYPMPETVREALIERGLMDAYLARPPYQRRHAGATTTSAGSPRARRPETQAKRLAQMLEELAGGDRYMKMEYRPRRATIG